MNKLQANKICWKAYYAGILDDTEFESLIDVYMPHKGHGNISVHEDDVQKSIDILKDFVGEYEFEYCPQGFITKYDCSDEFYYGKLDIDDVKGLILTLIENDVRIQSILFW